MEHEVQILQRDRRSVAERQQPQVRVGAYCRVSTEMEEQQSSLDLQIKTFQDQIALHAGWTLVDIYADDGVSGTMASKRTEFQRMIQDCREGKIDYIITKSISRFASEKRITRQQVRYILQNEVYVGDKLLQKRNPKDLHTKQTDPKREKTSRYLSEDHVPIISRELWNAVQTRFNKNGGKCENRKNAHFLAGRLYCAQCGSVFMRKTYKDRQGNLNRAWKCKGREAVLCTAPIWKEDDLISQISQISQTGSEAQIEQGSGNYLIIGKEIKDFLINAFNESLI